LCWVRSLRFLTPPQAKVGEGQRPHPLREWWHRHPSASLDWGGDECIAKSKESNKKVKAVYPNLLRLISYYLENEMNTNRIKRHYFCNVNDYYI
jgi:hypothetical protein